MSKLEPPVLVIPNPLRTEWVPKGLTIEVEYLQEDIVGEIADCHGSDSFLGGRVRIGLGAIGANVSFGGKSVKRGFQPVEHTIADGIPQL